MACTAGCYKCWLSVLEASQVLLSPEYAVRRGRYPECLSAEAEGCPNSSNGVSRSGRYVIDCAVLDDILEGVPVPRSVNTLDLADGLSEIAAFLQFVAKSIQEQHSGVGFRAKCLQFWEY